MKNIKRRVQVQNDAENDPPIKIEDLNEKKKQVLETSQNIHKIQFSIRQESKQIICVKSLNDNQGLNPQKIICLQHYDDNQFQNKEPLKGIRIAQKQITLGQVNSFIVGYDFKIYNFLDKNINNGMLIGLQKQQKKHDEITQQKAFSRIITCNCKKSKCLKLYCECFSQEEVCSERCQCQGCHNIDSNHKERKQAVQQLKNRNPQAFEKKIGQEEEDSAVAIKYSKGCNCKKSGCQKKYCECYQLGIKCSIMCKCKNCYNIEQPINHDKGNSKKQTHSILSQFDSQLGMKQQHSIKWPDQEIKQNSNFGSFSKLLQQQDSNKH